MRRIEERKNHDKLRVSEHTKGFACVFYTLKIKLFYKKLMQRLGVIFLPTIADEYRFSCLGAVRMASWERPELFFVKFCFKFFQIKYGNFWEVYFFYLVKVMIVGYQTICP